MPVESGGGGGGGAAEGVSILFGNTTQTIYHLTHKLQTYDFVYSVRTTTDRRYVHVDVYAEDKNRVMVVLAEPATTSNEFMINIVPVKNTEPGGDDVVVREYTEPALTWSLENATNLPMFVQAFEIDGEHQEMHGDITQEDEESFDPVRVTFSVPKAGIMVASPSTYFYEFTDQTRLVYTPGGDQYYGVQVVTETDNEGVVNPDIVQSNGTITIDFNGVAKTGYVVIIEPKMAIKFENTSLWRVVHNLGRYTGIQAYVIDDGQAMVPVFNVSENECYADFGNTSVSGYLLVI